MSLFKRLAGLASVFLILCATAFADGGEWRVVETSGSVRIAQTMTGVQMISTGETLRAGSVLSTGLDGRAVLMRGEQSIVVGPNSRMSLPAVEDEGMTRILQDLGTLMFKVDKRGRQHFRVETPVIAAVVKGTTFTVTAGADSHAVHVAEGLVEVTALSNGQSVLVAAGETVQVSTATYNFLTPGNDGDENRDNEESYDLAPAKGGKRASLVIPGDIGLEPLDYAGLTDGLVKTGRAGAPAVETTPDLDFSHIAGVQTASYADVASAGGELGLSVNAGVGGGSLDVGAGIGGVSAVASVGGGIDVGASVGDAVDVGASAGAGGLDVTAGVGGALDVGASAGAGGVDVGAGVGGIDASAEVGGDGIDVGAGIGDVADVGASVGGGGAGIDISVGGGDGVVIDADVGNDGIDLDLGGLSAGLGLDEDGLDLSLGGKGGKGGLLNL